MRGPASIAAVALLLAVACQRSVEPAKYTVLDASSEALQARFNEDVGKTRVLMLVAPT